MEQLVEYAIRGVFIGAVYGLIAIPMAFLYITTDAVDLAVGSYAVLAGVIAKVVGGVVGVGLGIGAAIAAAGLAAFAYFLLARRESPEPITIVLITFGIATGLGSLVLLVWGKHPFVATTFGTFWTVGEIRISPQGAVNLGVALGLLALLFMLLYRSSLGRSMRASAVNPSGASLAGIPVLRIQVGTFLAGGLLAGIAGVLVLYTSGLDYTTGLSLALLGLSAAVLFGLHNPLRAFAGGIAIGVIQALSVGYLSAGTAGIIPLAFIVILLATGRMGRISLSEARP